MNRSLNRILLNRLKVTPSLKRFRCFSSSSSDSKASSSSSSLKSFKYLWKKYGYVFVGTYLGVYGTTLGTIFLALDFDIFKASDFGYDAKTLTQTACEKIEYFTGIKSVPEYIRNHPWAGVLAIAWVLTKFTEPVRLAATVVLVPRIARYLRR